MERARGWVEERERDGSEEREMRWRRERGEVEEI